MPHLAKSSRQRFLCRVPHIGHSVKPLPSVTAALGKKNPTSTLTASLPSATAECHTLALGKEIFSFFKKIFAECHGSGTRQSWEIGSLLPSFAECHGHGTRQSPLCRVWHSAKTGKMFFFGFLLSISTNKEITYISTHNTGYITYTSIFHHIHIHNPSHTHPPSIIHHIQIHCP